MSEKAKRHCDGYYWHVNHEWIKQQILQTYSNLMDRELIISENMSNYGTLGYLFFGLNGSPPKGCAVYQPEHKFLVIIDAWGKVKKVFRNVIIDIEAETTIP